MTHTVILNDAQEAALIESAKRQSMNSEILLVSIVVTSLSPLVNELAQADRDAQLAALVVAKSTDTKAQILAAVKK